MHEKDGPRARESVAPGSEPRASGAPGQATLTSRLPRRFDVEAIAVQLMSRLGLAPAPAPAPVQRREATPAASAEAQEMFMVAHDVAGGAQAIADRGFTGGGGPLPHLDRIQASFGRHDVSGVPSHVGGAAAEAAQDLGAVAYASGGRVAFEQEPDLFVAAHEAAHVVQQRGGVQLAGGLGQVGDEYERHADEVAAVVVSGGSAEHLLDRYAGDGPGFAGVQLMTADEARLMLTSFHDMSQRERRRQVHAWGPAYTDDLLASVTERDRTRFRAEIRVIEQIRNEANQPAGEAPAAGTEAPDQSQAPAAAERAGPPAPDQAPRPGANPEWDAFASAFDAHFPDDVVRTFRAGGEAAQMDADGRRQSGQAVAAITGEAMRQHFTDSQRQRLTTYFENRQLPERLFNTGEHGPAGLSVAQRRLMSAHMLSIGTYERSDLEAERQQALAERDAGPQAPARGGEPAPEQGEAGEAPLARAPAGPQQRVEARMCMHWVQLVNAYAGAGDANRDGVMGNFDHDNNLVINSDREARREISSTTPRDDQGNDQGTAFTKEEIDRIQPGDWLYIDMDTGTGRSMHSVVFSQFVDTEWPARGVQFKRVIMYDQAGPNREVEGGSRNERQIGPVEGGNVKTVHRRQSGGANARPAETPDDVVAHDDQQIPGPLRRRQGITSIEADNNQYIEERGIRPPENAMRDVRAHNRQMIAELQRTPNRHGEPCMNEEQAELLGRTNAEDRLESVVRLNERLRVWLRGARALAAAEPLSTDRYEETHRDVDRSEEFNRGTVETTGLLRTIWGSVPHEDHGTAPEGSCEVPSP